MLIIGGGITGAALLHALTTFSTISSITLLEKGQRFAQGNSAHRNNSQTLHFGDIETNYSLERAASVKVGAEMVRRYVESRPKQKLFRKTHKIVLGIGEEEVDILKARHVAFRKLFPGLKLLQAEDIHRLEPLVMSGRSAVPIIALTSEDGYAVNFEALAQCMIKEAEQEGISVQPGVRVKSIRQADESFLVMTDQGKYQAKILVVAAGGYGLRFAQQLGYGLKYAILPVSASFYSAQNILRGKVYRVQHPQLSFAAIHGDADVNHPEETRFGPTAMIQPWLERKKYRQISHFLREYFTRKDNFLSLLKIIVDPLLIGYMIRQIPYELPIIGKYFFLKKARAIVPSLRANQLSRKQPAGIRPQIVDAQQRKLLMAEVKIVGERSIFNLSPSPGASMCLKSAEDDAKMIVAMLPGHSFDQKAFDKVYRA